MFTQLKLKGIEALERIHGIKVAKDPDFVYLLFIGNSADDEWTLEVRNAKNAAVIETHKF